jgi:DNA-3-methyladenine glycosylase
VYVSYGMHLCVNVVTGPEGSGEALLLRSAVVVDGEGLVRERRARGRDIDPASLRERELLTGPGRLAQGLDIRLADTGRLIVDEQLDSLAGALEVGEHGPVVYRDTAAAARVGLELPVAPDRILVGPRIGITKAIELPWRYGVRDLDVSRPFPGVSARTGGRRRRA